MHDPMTTENALAAGMLSNLDVAQIASFAQLILPVLEKRALASETPWDDVVYVAASELLTSQRFIESLQKAIDASKKPVA